MRFLLTETEPHVSLYVSPINIDPENPALPISQPAFYAAYLAKLLGPYSTLGMAEDTWALNEGVIGEADFLKQAYLLKSGRTCSEPRWSTRGAGWWRAYSIPAIASSTCSTGTSKPAQSDRLRHRD